MEGEWSRAGAPPAEAAVPEVDGVPTADGGRPRAVSTSCWSLVSSWCWRLGKIEWLATWRNVLGD